MELNKNCFDRPSQQLQKGGTLCCSKNLQIKWSSRSIRHNIRLVSPQPWMTFSANLHHNAEKPLPEPAEKVVFLHEFHATPTYKHTQINWLHCNFSYLFTDKLKQKVTFNCINIKKQNKQWIAYIKKPQLLFHLKPAVAQKEHILIVFSSQN